MTESTRNALLDTLSIQYNWQPSVMRAMYEFYAPSFDRLIQQLEFYEAEKLEIEKNPIDFSDIHLVGTRHKINRKSEHTITSNGTVAQQ